MRPPSSLHQVPGDPVAQVGLAFPPCGCCTKTRFLLSIGRLLSGTRPEKDGAGIGPGQEEKGKAKEEGVQKERKEKFTSAGRARTHPIRWLKKEKDERR